MAIEKLKINHD